MNKYNYQRAKTFAHYLLIHNCTIRCVASHFGYGKSTVHNDLKKLKDYEPSLYSEVQRLLDVNYSEKHLRGGEVTKQKYKLLSNR